MSFIQSTFGGKVSPLILFIIVLLAVVFFISGLLHLLIRFLLKRRSRRSQSQNNYHPELSSATSGAFQRQLQQLFHLHDSGLDQTYIDALPVFPYRDLIVGSKEPFDCPVCLCEFTEEDRLRLLPLCSHAFHIDCIDTWLLSNSTCPLCRGVILAPGVSFENPVFYFDDPYSSKELIGEDLVGTANAGFLGVIRPNHHQGDVINNNNNSNGSVINEKRVFSVRLGKFKNITNCSNSGHHNNENHQLISEVGESSNSSNLDARRCYSMGSFQYVVADLDLQVALCPSGRDRRKDGVDGQRPPVKGGRSGGLFGNFTSGDEDGVINIGKRISSGAKGESFSVSKIWLWSKKGKSSGSDNVAVHF